MSKKPVIGITSAFVKHNHFMEGPYVHRDYHKSVAANGGIPIILPFMDENIALETLSLCEVLSLAAEKMSIPFFMAKTCTGT